jgi:Ca-activated chloride channel family protein
VSRSIEAFQPDPERGRALVLFSDGEAHEGDLEEAIAKARTSRVRICAVGIGKEEGEPIPLRARPGETPQYKKDRHDRVVITRLHEQPLQSLCQATGGTYVRAGTGSTSEAIYSALRDLQQGEVEGGLGIRYEERFAYFAGLALLLLFIEGSLGERRRR